MFLYVILTALSDSVSKLVYLDHPTLSVFEFLFWRTGIQLIFLIGLMNKDSKTYLVDKIERDLLTPLIIRVVSGVASFLCLYYAIKYLPIFLVSLILNTSPIFTSFLAFLFLKEKVSKMEVFALFFAFFGVYVLISSSKTQ
jgi:drug/metabolite transporter (DMT)-like permease